jgi:hypothetical protein
MCSVVHGWDADSLLARLLQAQPHILIMLSVFCLLQVSLGGVIVGPDAPVSHLRAHTTPTGPIRQPHRQSTASPASRPSSSSNQTLLTPSWAGSCGGALPGIHTAGSSYGGAHGSSAAGVEQEHSLPDVAARSLRSSGGVRGGVVAAAVAAINSMSPSDSPRSFAGSASGTGCGRRVDLSGLHTECSSYGGQDTYQDLDSPSKGLDSPSRHEWVTPPGPKVTASRIPGYGSQGASSSHKNLSLRGRGPAAKPASPAAASYTPDRAGAGRQATPPGAYGPGAGVTGRRGMSGGGAAVSLRGGSTPGGSRGEIGLRKPAGVRR